MPSVRPAPLRSGKGDPPPGQSSSVLMVSAAMRLFGASSSGRPSAKPTTVPIPLAPIRSPRTAGSDIASRASLARCCKTASMLLPAESRTAARSVGVASANLAFAGNACAAVFRPSSKTSFKASARRASTWAAYTRSASTCRAIAWADGTRSRFNGSRKRSISSRFVKPSPSPSSLGRSRMRKLSNCFVLISERTQRSSQPSPSASMMRPCCPLLWIRSLAAASSSGVSCLQSVSGFSRAWAYAAPEQTKAAARARPTGFNDFIGRYLQYSIGSGREGQRKIIL